MYRLVGVLLASALLALSHTSYANTGSVTFTNMAQHYGSPKINLDLSRELILMSALLSGNTDPELQAILRKLDLVKIRVYDTLGRPEHAMQSIESQTEGLTKENWFRVINRDEEGDITRVFTRSKDQLIEGVVVMKLERGEGSGELAFVNIVGQMDPSEIKRVAENLNFNFGL